MSPFCPGSKVSGSVPIRAVGCAQTLRGRLIDTESGNVLVELEPTDVPEGESLDFDFSFEMPWKAVPLKAVIERKVGENWEVVDTPKLSVDFLEPSTSISSLKVPDRACADRSLEPSIEVTAEECPQRIRSRLVDEETGDVIVSWSTEELGAEKGTSFKFPSKMPWRNILLKTEVERFNPVTEAWERIGSDRKEIEQKEPATGESPSREVPKFARPGYSTTGSVTVENTGECEGGVRVEGFIGGSRMMREDYTLGPGDSKTPTYATTMPPSIKANVGFRVLSQRKNKMDVTSSISDQITAARAVLLDKGTISIHGGEKSFAYSGVIIAKNVEWDGPDVIEEENPISPLRPLKGKVRPYMFAGRVDAEGIDTITFEPNSLVYLKTTTEAGNTWSTYKTIQDKDTKLMTYSAIEYPFVIARSELAERSVEELIEVAGIG